jgi:small nuclear ribonucleoprotein (snRNP)-like protein
MFAWDIVTGTLKGYDALMNLVLDDVDEVVRGMCSFPPLRFYNN